MVSKFYILISFIFRFLVDIKNKEHVPQKYRLRAVIVQDGSYYDGHHYAFIQPANTNDWLKFNDAIIEKVTFEQVLYVRYLSYHSIFIYCSTYIL